MTRRKSVCSKWTLVLLVVIFCPSVYPRPQDSSPSSVISSSTLNIDKDKPTEIPIRESSQKNQDALPKTEDKTTTVEQNSGRDVKTKAPVIRESIKLVANQLLDKPSNASGEVPIVADTRIPPKIKNQVSHKHSIKTRNDDGDEPLENGHAGVAVPVTMEDLEKENKLGESSTTNEGISTWILLSNPANFTGSTEPTKLEDTTKKQKPTTQKNKPKRPQTNKNPVVKRPIIGSTNKSDLVAGGSAINENVYNKIKDTVLSNVQKNKISTTQRITTISTTIPPTTTEVITTKKEVTKAVSTVSPVVKITSKPVKKKNKNKHKTSSTTSTTTLAPVENESALLPMEPKEQEIELEISTPATTTKKPRRSSSKKKTKTKKRKTSKKPEAETAVTDIKTTSNKTKSTKPAKKPSSTTGPFTTQIYNYLSREVMPVGVGVIGLASLVGLASYFLYPFSTPVRRTFDVDKKDDLYRNNAEEYANEGNGQAEEEMLGTVLAGMPAHAKHKINPYAGQTVAHGNTRYTVKKEQDIKYRHVAANREPNYNLHYPQQKTGIAHGAVYSKPVNYSPHQYETRNIYTTESKYTYDKGSNAYTPYPAVEPIYAAPQTGPSAGTGYGSDVSNSVVYGVKPSSETDFRPVYPFEGQIYSETTSNPATYSPTSMYLGSNDDSEDTESNKYEENESSNGEDTDNKFVVGNVPKELVDSATPAVVPEHGPRKLRKRRHIINKRSVRGSIEEFLNDAKNRKDIFISNEIDDSFGYVKHITSFTDAMLEKNEMTVQPETKDVFTVYAEPANPSIDQKTTSTDVPSTFKNDVVESVSTVPINTSEKSTTEGDTSNELETTTKTFRVYEVFSNPTEANEQNSPLVKDNVSTTTFKNMMTETTTELKSETTSTMPPSVSPISEPGPSKSTINYKDTDPDVITYPPPRQENGFFSLLRRFLEFKYRLGMSILQTTSDNLKRYLEDTAHNVAKAS